MTSEETVRRVKLDLAKGKKIKQIARDRGMDPKTVRKIRDTKATKFEYVRKTVHHPALEPHKKKLQELLNANALLDKRHRRPLVQLFEDLQTEGFTGGYDSVRRFANRYGKEISSEAPKTDAIDAFVPLSFARGEAYQFDWGTDYVLINGVSVQVKVAHITLCHSRMTFSRIYRRETLEMVLDAHEKAFAFFGGVTEQGIYDNMSTAVTKVLMGKDRDWNIRFSEYCSHHGVEHVACNPASGWEKGRVERKVQTGRVDFFKPIPRTEDDSLEELNRQFLDRSIECARRRRHPEREDKTVWEVFQEEQEYLRPMKPGFELCVEHQRRCSKTCLVQVDRNHYSAHYSASQHSVTVHVYADSIVLRHHGEVVAEHRRHFGRGHTILDYRHYIEVVDKKPGALRHGAPFQGDNLPPALKSVWQHIKGRKRGDREFANILSLVMDHGEDLVVSACKEVLREGAVSEATIINKVLRMAAPEPLMAVEPEVEHQLQHPPSSDCSEYDLLLRETYCEST